MLYPIWQPWPRPRFFPSDADLDRLLDRYDPRVGYLKLSMKRRHARDLRKGLFGPKGLTFRGPIVRIQFPPAASHTNLIFDAQADQERWLRGTGCFRRYLCAPDSARNHHNAPPASGR